MWTRHMFTPYVLRTIGCVICGNVPDLHKIKMTAMSKQNKILDF